MRPRVAKFDISLLEIQNKVNFSHYEVKCVSGAKRLPILYDLRVLKKISIYPGQSVGVVC